MCQQQKASPKMRFHQTNHLYKLEKKSRPRTKLCDTPILIFYHLDVCPSRTVLWNVFDRKLLIGSNKSAEIQRDLNLNIKSRSKFSQML